MKQTCQTCLSREVCVGPPGRLEVSELVFVLANISSSLLTIAVTLLADNKQVRQFWALFMTQGLNGKLTCVQKWANWMNTSLGPRHTPQTTPLQILNCKCELSVSSSRWGSSICPGWCWLATRSLATSASPLPSSPHQVLVIKLLLSTFSNSDEDQL